MPQPPRPPFRSFSLRPPSLRRPSRFRWWLGAGALAIVTGLTVGRLVADAEAARHRWGALRPVVVAVDDLPAGAAVGADDVELRHLPGALVPRGGLDRLPSSAITASPVLAGEVLLARRLAPSGLSPVAALLPPGTRGIAVPGGTGLALEVGDTVDVLATFTGAAGHDAEPTFAVARRALVVHVADEAVTVAVAEATAAKVAYALTAGSVMLALTGTR